MKNYVILKFSLSWREQLSYIFLPVVFISEDVYPPFLNLFKSPLFGILVLNVAMFIYLFKFPLFGILVLKCGHFYIFVQIPPAWHSCFKMWPLFSSSPPLSFNLMPASDTREKETVFFENSKLQISSDKRSGRERRRIVPVVLVCQSWLFAAGQNWRKWANSDIPPQLVRCLRQGEEGWNKQHQRYKVTLTNGMIIYSCPTQLICFWIFICFGKSLETETWTKTSQHLLK